MNVRLRSGRKESDNQHRFELLNDIRSICFQKTTLGNSKRKKIDQHDQIFLLGDLNFGLDLEQKQFSQIAKDYQSSSPANQRLIIQQMLRKDSLTRDTRQFQQNLYMYEEAEINFLPNFQTSKSNKYNGW